MCVAGIAIITEACIDVKDRACVAHCPVSCIYEATDQLVINPDECIDCGVCEPECPPAAIVPDSDPKGDGWLKLNTEFSAMISSARLHVTSDRSNGQSGDDPSARALRRCSRSTMRAQTTRAAMDANP